MTSIASLGSRLRSTRYLLVVVLLLAAGCAPPVAERTSPSAAAGVAAATPSARSLPAAASPSPATATPSATPAATAIPSATPAASNAADTAFSGQRALETVRLLSETIGSRPAGSDAERRAAEELAERLRGLGWQAEIQPFPVRSFEDRGSSLRVDDGPSAPLGVLALQNSAPGRVSGRLVNAGLGRREDLAGLDLNGAIALLERGEIAFGDKVANVAQAGAVGAVIYNQEPVSFRGLLQD